MGPIPYGGGEGGVAGPGAYIYIYMYIIVCVYIYTWKTKWPKFFVHTVFCHFFWLLRVVPRYAHIRFEGCNFGNLVFQPWGMSCDDLPWPTPSCSTSSAL